jgi:hypothetical protein
VAVWLQEEVGEGVPSVCGSDVLWPGSEIGRECAHDGGKDCDDDLERCSFATICNTHNSIQGLFSIK